jgi:hypothetical protein
VAIEAMIGDDPALVLIHGENRVRVGLHNVTALIEALIDATMELLTILVDGEVRSRVSLWFFLRKILKRKSVRLGWFPLGFSLPSCIPSQVRYNSCVS